MLSFQLNHLFIATLAGIGVASLVGQQPSLAQLNQPDRPSGFESVETNPCAGAAQNGNLNVLSLMNCAQLNGSSWDARQPLQGLDDAVKKYQLEVQQQAKPNNGQFIPTNGEIVFPPVAQPEQSK
ncbi:MAG: hypothetical protein KME21_07345 [Desmonostoc vinosum HA7617-LM4]|nr:hypothetical protein [Desmonostoc vinosum HA7617-LM4]